MIDQYLTEEQDPKTVEKMLGKLQDMLTSGEAILYLAVQKKPAVTITPDCIAVTNKRIIFCLPGNLGLTTNFIIFPWQDIKEVSFKEEFFGAKFITVPLKGENISIDYIPKIQARKLYQFSNEQMEKQKDIFQKTEISKEPAILSNVTTSEPEAVAPTEKTQPEPEEDEITQKLKRLKSLFEKQLITQEEYEAKKADLLSQL
ncbi:PH domain-containing protein [Rubrolithibacter danxiaensis]|uniref:PH domain-containing protein n=1 Tax=Rubrolithibacter danxiaensis TaxID=3390805 RepID=UPI003BF85CCE